MKMIEVRFR